MIKTQKHILLFGLSRHRHRLCKRLGQNLSSTKMSQIFVLCEFNCTVVKPVAPHLMIEFRSCFYNFLFVNFELNSHICWLCVKCPPLIVKSFFMHDWTFQLCDWISNWVWNQSARLAVIVYANLTLDRHICTKRDLPYRYLHELDLLWRKLGDTKTFSCRTPGTTILSSDWLLLLNVN